MSLEMEAKRDERGSEHAGVFMDVSQHGGRRRQRTQKVRSTRLAQDASVVCVHVSIGVTNFWSFRRDKLLLLATVVKKVAS